MQWRCSLLEKVWFIKFLLFTHREAEACSMLYLRASFSHEILSKSKIYAFILNVFRHKFFLSKNSIIIILFWIAYITHVLSVFHLSHSLRFHYAYWAIVVYDITPGNTIALKHTFALSSSASLSLSEVSNPSIRPIIWEIRWSNCCIWKKSFISSSTISWNEFGSSAMKTDQRNTCSFFSLTSPFALARSFSSRSIRWSRCSICWFLPSSFCLRASTWNNRTK